VEEAAAEAAAEAIASLDPAARQALGIAGFTRLPAGSYSAG
jgi:hypothetical protein